jgi:hypothetical protein
MTRESYDARVFMGGFLWRTGLRTRYLWYGIILLGVHVVIQFWV